MVLSQISIAITDLLLDSIDHGVTNLTQPSFNSLLCIDLYILCEFDNFSILTDHASQVRDVCIGAPLKFVELVEKFVHLRFYTFDVVLAE